MTRSLLVCTLLAAASLGSTGAACAQTPAQGLRPFVGFGLTGGGDRIATIEYTDGSSSAVHAGGLLEFKGGADFAIAPNINLRASLGYHVDNSNARNGSFRFQRWPLELLGLWRIDPQWRLGAGLRKALGPKTSGSGFATGMNSTLTSTLGFVAEGEYTTNSRFSIYLRGVGEQYKVNGESLNGSHVGAGINFYF
jgi:opacity protein-like surface antigen